jgi:hypothetical protein
LLKRAVLNAHAQGLSYAVDVVGGGIVNAVARIPASDHDRNTQASSSCHNRNTQASSSCFLIGPLVRAYAPLDAAFQLERHTVFVGLLALGDGGIISDASQTMLRLICGFASIGRTGNNQRCPRLRAWLRDRGRRGSEPPSSGLSPPNEVKELRDLADAARGIPPTVQMKSETLREYAAAIEKYLAEQSK